MSWAERARDHLASTLDVEVRLDEGFGPPTIDVPADRWADALTAVRDGLGCSYFDWLSAVDELEQGFAVVCHLAALGAPDAAAVEHLLIRTRVPRDAARLPTAIGVYAGAAWHERETHEMFGIEFAGNDALTPLLLPDEFEGHPLRKDFVLAARVAKAWPGAKEPGESDHDAARAPSRRRVAPPGVPAAEAWGPRPPGSPAPDPLAVAAPARPVRRAARPPRAPRTATPSDQESAGDG
ncbi:NADH-quinone oxidoreductase subunit C [Actinopolymorpha alba]|uniref:NADH-quinone oxidoreductase subunit C n=1 Tax=Actinopolymorpha alba TaxID=533267 RepID=UPI00037EAA0F|nr:NADH-quinone oxidoreductase subunit C [Actinopolymorpha alba]